MPRYIDADKADVEQISCFYGAECRLEDVQEWLDEQPTADVVPRAKYELAVAEREANVKGFAEDIAKAKSEVAKKICCEIEEKICAALKSNCQAFTEHIKKYGDKPNLEFLCICNAKTSALRGIEAFVEELKEKYTKGDEGK